ncbi:TonB family protein [Hymenobacter sp. 9A]|uniref:TonB family protein n=1 Tax=Hymenobacter caeli TaxID=2735894 RepID=A0ABX2FNH5_9BACT|nr:TonB family protein [Hymenobacter caeli]NRT18024.1 TonB family protein [Hymenobacter caeli]
MPPPKTAAKALVNAAATAQDYLRAHLPNWQPGTPDPRAGAGQVAKVVLALNFTAAPAAQPYAYADQQPVFAEMPTSEKARAEPKPVYSTRDLISQVQRQTRYPRAALVNQEMGVAYVYFEVTETGAIEQMQVVGPASPSLDEETLRVLRTMPAAASPALLRGQPVRVYYVLPITFRIQ